MRTTTKLTLALFLSLPLAASAAVPTTLAFSARIGDNGRPVTGNHTVKFAFWDCDGSNPATCVDPTDVLWSETQTLTVSDGVLNAVLGADTTTPNPIPFAVYAGGPVFLEVTFDGVAFSPRMSIHSVPFAIHAGVADIAGAVPWAGVIGKALSCQTVNSPGVSVAANSYGADQATCPAGTRATGGGFITFLSNAYPDYMYVGDNYYYTEIFNARATAVNLTVFARCCSL